VPAAVAVYCTRVPTFKAAASCSFEYLSKKMAAPKGGHHDSNNFGYQRKIVILWMYAVIEPPLELAPSNWKLISRSPRAQPRLSAE
jgi:hypothetical protein